MSRFASLAVAATAVLLAACGGDSVAPSPSLPGTPPSVLPTEWRAVSADGKTLPMRAYDFPNEPAPGLLTYYTLDSAKVTLGSDGRFRHTSWYSEWRAAAPGQSGGDIRLYGYTLGDFGEWTRAGDRLELDSGYFQNRIIRGTVTTAGITLRHGLSLGDPSLDVRYAPVP